MEGTKEGTDEIGTEGDVTRQKALPLLGEVHRYVCRAEGLSPKGRAGDRRKEGRKGGEELSQRGGGGRGVQNGVEVGYAE
jgi:hypothetical protein